jgi:hypothetical protein
MYGSMRAHVCLPAGLCASCAYVCTNVCVCVRMGLCTSCGCVCVCPSSVVDRHGQERLLKNPNEFPEDSTSFGVQYYEPVVAAVLTFPKQYLGPLLTLCEVRCESRPLEPSRYRHYASTCARITVSLLRLCVCLFV